MTLRPVLWLAVSLLFASCASASKARVVEMENGHSAAIGTAKNESDAVIAAVDQAQKYCSNQNDKKPVFKDDLGQSPDEKKSGPHINLKKIPVLGKVFADEDDAPKVVMEFACK